jgi:ABC-type methionine transport system ATPase subunit
MAKQRFMFTFPLEKIKEPVIFELVKKFDLIPNIRRADINDSYSWMILEIEGPKSTLAEAIKWVRKIGVEVNEMDGDMVEG